VPLCHAPMRRPVVAGRANACSGARSDRLAASGSWHLVQDGGSPVRHVHLRRRLHAGRRRLGYVKLRLEWLRRPHCNSLNRAAPASSIWCASHLDIPGGGLMSCRIPTRFGPKPAPVGRVTPCAPLVSPSANPGGVTDNSPGQTSLRVPSWVTAPFSTFSLSPSEGERAGVRGSTTERQSNAAGTPSLSSRADTAHSWLSTINYPRPWSVVPWSVVPWSLLPSTIN